MKTKLLYILILLFSINLEVFAQQENLLNQMSDPNNRYYDIVNYANQFFAQNPSLTTVEDGIYTEYLRWKNFWESRTYNSKNGSGNLTKGNAIVSSFLFQPICTIASSYSGHWQPIGPLSYPFQNQGKVHSILVDPSDPNTVYLGLPGGGVFKCSNFLSTTQQPHWICMTEHTGLYGLWVNSMVINPYTHDLFIAATNSGRDGYGVGVIGLHQNGTYFQTPLSVNATQQITNIPKIIIHPTNPSIMYAISPGNVYYTNDGGVTWPSIYDVTIFGNNDFKDIEFFPSNPNKIIVSGSQVLIHDINTLGIWQNTTSALSVHDSIVRIEVLVSNNNLYAIYKNGSDDRMDVSTNNGLNWSLYKDIADNSILFGTEIAMHPNTPDVFYCEKLGGGTSGRRVNKTIDGGLNFQTCSE